MQVLYFCSDSHWKNIMILPHFSPYGQSSKTKSGMELAKVAHVRQSLMWCSLSHSSGNSPHSPFLTDSTMALTSISRFWSTISSSWRTHEALPNCACIFCCSDFNFSVRRSPSSKMSSVARLFLMCWVNILSMSNLSDEDESMFPKGLDESSLNIFFNIIFIIIFLNISFCWTCCCCPPRTSCIAGRSTPPDICCMLFKAPITLICSKSWWLSAWREQICVGICTLEDRVQACPVLYILQQPSSCFLRSKIPLPCVQPTAFAASSFQTCLRQRGPCRRKAFPCIRFLYRNGFGHYC